MYYVFAYFDSHGSTLCKKQKQRICISHSKSCAPARTHTYYCRHTHNELSLIEQKF